MQCNRYKNDVIARVCTANIQISVKKDPIAQCHSIFTLIHEK